MDITDETVLATAPLTAKVVRPLTANVAVMLVGWDQTVALVIFFLITNDNNPSHCQLKQKKTCYPYF